MSSQPVLADSPPVAHTTSHPRSFLALTVLYLIAHGLILLDRGVYWDDWTLFNMAPATILQLHADAGLPLSGYMHVLLQGLPGAVFLYNLLTLGAFLLCGWLTWRILHRTGLLTPTEVFWVTLFTMVLPLNLARNVMMVFIYTVCFTLFLVGFDLFQRDQHAPRRSAARVLAAAVLFFLSFITNSLLVFFVLVPLYAIWRQRPTTLTAFIKAGLQQAGWLALPILYWVYKSIFLKPAGLWAEAGYNAVTAGKLLRVPVDAVRSLYYSFGRVMLMSGAALRPGIAALLALVLGGAALYAFRRTWLPGTAESTPRRRALIGLVAGLALFQIGLFPYLAAGRFPSLNDWSSRHQLLLPLGTALMLYFGVALAASFAGRPGARLRTYGLLLLTLAFLALDIKSYIAYHRDWLKRSAFMTLARRSPELRTGHTFELEERTRDWNVFGTEWRFHEIAGMLKLVFGTEDRFVESANYREHLAATFSRGLATLDHRPEENMSQWNHTMPLDYRLIIEPGQALSDGEVLRTELGVRAGSAEADSVVARMIRLRFEPITP